MPKSKKKIAPIAFRPGELYEREFFTSAPGCSESQIAARKKETGLSPRFLYVGRVTWIAGEDVIDYLKQIGTHEQPQAAGSEKTQADRGGKAGGQG